MKNNVITFLIFTFISQYSHAIQFQVNTLSDGIDISIGDGRCETAQGQCTLRAAIMETNHLPGKDKIIFEDGGVYQLNLFGQIKDQNPMNGDLDITDDLEIEGITIAPQKCHPERWVTIQGQSRERIFDILNQKIVSMSCLTLENGRDDFGGAIRVQGHTTLKNMIIRSNQAESSGGAVHISDSQVKVNFDNIKINNNTCLDHQLNFAHFEPTGGISVSKDVTLTMKNMEFNNNRSEHASGVGALFISKYVLSSVIQDTVFNSNNSRGRASAVALGNGETYFPGRYSSSITFNTIELKNNHCQNFCPTFSAWSPASLVNITFKNNTRHSPLGVTNRSIALDLYQPDEEFFEWDLMNVDFYNNYELNQNLSGASTIYAYQGRVNANKVSVHDNGMSSNIVQNTDDYAAINFDATEGYLTNSSIHFNYSSGILFSHYENTNKNVKLLHNLVAKNNGKQVKNQARQRGPYRIELDSNIVFDGSNNYTSNNLSGPFETLGGNFIEYVEYNYHIFQFMPDDILGDFTIGSQNPMLLNRISKPQSRLETLRLSTASPARNLSHSCQYKDMWDKTRDIFQCNAGPLEK